MKLHLLVLLMIFAACSNELVSDDSVIDARDIRIDGYIEPEVATRMTGESFESGDQIGLFITSDDYKLSGKRYVDNVQMTYDGSAFESEESLTFPAINKTYSFIAYYPYDENGVNPGSSLLGFTIETDQSSKDNYQKSDLLTAVASYQTKSNANTVTLPFKHALSTIGFTVTAKTEALANKVVNSTIFLADVMTSANINLETNEVFNLGFLADVSPYGTWSASKLGDGDDAEYVVSGMKAVVIPQDVSSMKISLSVAGKKYVCDVPEAIALQSGHSYMVNLSYTDNGIAVSQTTDAIEGWVEEDAVDQVMSMAPNYLALSDLDLDTYPVYNIYNSSNVLLGQVCREYLYSSNVDATAVVYYPNCNLSEGTLLRYVSGDDSTCGGSVAWSSNVLTYMASDKAPVESICIDDDGYIVSSYSKSVCNATAAKAYMLTDRRGTESNTYAVVKIGNQYWMKGELATTNYNDGTAIADASLSSDAEAAGYYINSGSYYYNKAAVSSLKMSPKGWHMPTETEIEVLKTLVNNDASALKTDSWASNEKVSSSNNKTGFSAKPIGFILEYSSGKAQYFGSGAYFGIWVMSDDASTVAASGMSFTSTSSEVKTLNQSSKKSAYSIRCIRNY
jgi:uncharacterized protein (TIGR02145 family)